MQSSLIMCLSWGSQEADLQDGASFTTLLDDNSEQLTIDKHSTPGRTIVVGANRAAYLVSPDVEDEKVCSFCHHVSISCMRVCPGACIRRRCQLNIHVFHGALAQTLM